jgi:hypothetical protein
MRPTWHPSFRPTPPKRSPGTTLPSTASPPSRVVGGGGFSSLRLGQVGHSSCSDTPEYIFIQWSLPRVINMHTAVVLIEPFPRTKGTAVCGVRRNQVVVSMEDSSCPNFLLQSWACFLGHSSVGQPLTRATLPNRDGLPCSRNSSPR